MKKLFFIWLMLEFSFSQAIAQNNLPPAYEIQTDTAVSIRLDDAYWQMLEDPEGKWTIDEVNRPPIANKFHANTTKIKGVENSIYTYWFRYRFKNSMNHDVKIALSRNANSADLYTLEPNGKWDHKITGTGVAWSKLDDLKQILTVTYTIQPGKELLIYERDNYDYFTGKPDLLLHIDFGFTDEVIHKYFTETDSFILPSFLFGLFVLAAVFNLYFFFVVRERAYLFFSLMLLGRGFSRFIDDSNIFFPEHPLVKWCLIEALGMFYFFFLIHFVRYFLQTFKYVPRWDKFLIGLSIYTIIIFILNAMNLIAEPYFALVMLFIFVTFTLFIRSTNKSVRWRVAMVLPGIGILLIPLFDFLFLSLRKYTGIQVPNLIAWLNNRFEILEGIALIWLLIFFSWSLFQRYQQLQKTIAQEAIAKERSAKEQATLQQQKTEIEMQALRAQMNPHFIFNSLNSINRFILQNNRLQASEYLTKFSKLVRMILQNSQASLITLESELESLQLYLELESVRFDNHFDYKISVPDDMDIEVLKVPPLILQPYTENAIWHGLMHKEEKGQLDIEVSEENNFLYFKVADNGIGRKQAAALASKSATRHKSMGLRITEHRIAMMQGENGTETPVTIRDLVDADGNAAGTEVIIKIPIIYDQGHSD